METSAQNFWRKCSSCKKPIALGAKHYVCSVSTCNGQRTGYAFCSVLCFEVHLPGARHKDAGAVEKTAPMVPYQADGGGGGGGFAGEPRAPARVMAKTSPVSSASSAHKIPREILVIASRLKDYIHARNEYNTSASVMDVLSDHLRIVCDRAIDNARSEGRKTVLDRDFDFLKKS